MEEFTEDLEGAVRAQVQRDSHLRDCAISIVCNGHFITLNGHVPTFYLKSLAQTAVLHLIRERELAYQVVNGIEVVSE
jgi:hypothetical protein